MQYTKFGFELRNHAAAKTPSGMALECKIVFGSELIPDDETDAQRDLESLILSGEILTFGEIDKVTSWSFAFPPVTPDQPDACQITFHYTAVAKPLLQQERVKRIERIFEQMKQLPANSN
jgi:hypothetical protein